MSKPSVFAAAFALVLASPALASAAEQETFAPPSPKPADEWKVSLETDPLPFAMNGYAAAVGVKPGGVPRLKLTAEGLSAQFPSFISDASGNKGWSARVTGGMLVGQVYWSEDKRGAYAGLVGSVFDWSLSAPNAAGTTHATYLELTPHVGYQWFPTKTGVFLSPWAGVAVPIKLGGTTTVGDQTFAQTPVIPFGAINLGYEI